MSEREPELGLGLVVSVDDASRRVALEFPATGERRLYALGTPVLKRVQFRAGESIATRDGKTFVIESVEDDAGVLVAGMEPNSPATRAGLLEGDILLSLDDASTPAVDSLHKLLTGDRIGERAIVKFLRGVEVRRHAIIPLEMVSVLAEYTSGKARFPVKGPAVGLFADQEIRMVDGPLFVGEDYVIRREIVALSESKRTESYWVKTRIYDATGETLKAEMLLNHASLKHSYAGYEEARAARS